MKSSFANIFVLAVLLSLSVACTQQSASNQPAPAPTTDVAPAQTPAPAATPAETKRMEATEHKAEMKGSGNQTSKPATPVPAPPPAPVTLVIPAGTGITIRMGSTVGSKISNAGDNFNGTVAQDVTVNGQTAIPAGAAVSGSVTDAKPLGRFAGGAALGLSLNALTVNGRSYNVQTATLGETEKGKGKRTAVLGGGGAAVGALIGGLAGGGKGALIGALAGGGAGTAGAAFTGNKDIVIPAEKALTFKLSSDLTIKR